MPHAQVTSKTLVAILKVLMLPDRLPDSAEFKRYVTKRWSGGCRRRLWGQGREGNNTAVITTRTITKTKRYAQYNIVVLLNIPHVLDGMPRSHGNLFGFLRFLPPGTSPIADTKHDSYSRKFSITNCKIFF